jgi:hypothetical protein
MKAKSLKCTMGSVAMVAMVFGLLAALPAQGSGGLLKITHSSTASKWVTQPVHKSVAKAQPTVGKAQPEVQVGVMAKSPSQPATRRAVFIRR